MKKIKSMKKRMLVKKRIIKGLVIGILLMIFYQGRYVEAGMNDSSIERNRVQNVYAVVTLDGVARLFYLNMYRMNGRVAYCIELGVDITTDIYHSTNDFSVTYLSAEQIEYIRTVSYFGYEYEGHNDYRYYMAAQELIWEYLSNTDVEWTHELDVNGIKMDISPYKKEVRTLVKRFYQSSEFLWTDGQKFAVGTKITLNDYGNLLSDYEIVDSGHSMVSIDGNNLIIEVAKDYVGEESIVIAKREFYSYDSLLYYYDSSQRLISNGNFKDTKITFNFEIIGVGMNVQVVDKDSRTNEALGQASLEGAEYEVYNSNHELIGVYRTNEDGSFWVSDLTYGDYYIKQIEASEGYLINSDEVKVELFEDNFYVELEQEVIANEVEIRKVYGDNGKYIAEGNIGFEIYDIDNILYREIVTDKEGIAEVWLPYGKYWVRQNNTTLGYEKVNDFEIIVQEEKEDKVYYNLVNEFMKCRVKVYTFDVESGLLIKEKGIAYRVKKSGEENYLEINGESIFGVDDDGILTLPMMFSYGDYVLEQVDISSGYLLNRTCLEFTIDEHANFLMVGNELYVEVNVYNQLIKGNVHILANEEVFYSSKNNYEYKKVSRENIAFLLVTNEDIVVNGELKYQEGEEIVEVFTDEEGNVLIENLYLGNYCLIDQELEERQCFILENIVNDEAIVLKELEFTKQLTKWNIVIQNKDDYDRNIEGSVWEVYDKDENLIYTGITNEDGIISIKDLVESDYCFRQKSVSSGYQLITDKYCFSLKEHQTFEFINEKSKDSSIWVPNTFSNKTNFFQVVSVVGLIGMMIFVYKKVFISK